MMGLPELPRAAYSLDLHDGFPTVAYSAQQMYDFSRSCAREAVRPIKDLVTLYQHSAMTESDFVIRMVEMFELQESQDV